MGILPRLNFFSGTDYDSDGGGDSGNDGGDEAGPSRRCRRRKSLRKYQYSSSSSSGDNTVTVYYTKQNANVVDRRQGNLVIREPEETRNRENEEIIAASMEVDQPADVRRSSSEL